LSREVITAYTIKDARKKERALDVLGIFKYSTRATGTWVEAKTNELVFAGCGVVVVSIGRKYLTAIVDGKTKKIAPYYGGDKPRIEFYNMWF